MIALIDYDAGNVCSVMNALSRLGVDYVLTDREQDIRAADKVIFPGVGHAGAAMQRLQNKGLDQVIIDLKQPVLGICVGMQLLCSWSEEGDTKGLGIVSAKVKKFKAESNLKVPHMGWNQISLKEDHLLFDGINIQDYLYFVHSYYIEDNISSIASCYYSTEFCAALCKDNFHGIQFHAEKSGPVGELLIANFINKV